MKPDTAIIILVDTREQAPYRFEGWRVEAAGLATSPSPAKPGRQRQGHKKAPPVTRRG